VLEEESEIKKMFNEINPCLYYSATLGLYAVQMAGAMAIPDVSIIFEFISAFSVSAIQFTLPGLFFYTSLERYGSMPYKEENKCHRRGAIAYIILGCICTVVILTNAIINVVSD